MVTHNDAAALLVRATLGAFFVLARFRFFYDPAKPEGERWLNKTRFTSLRNKMCHCGVNMARATFWTWFTAVVEVLGGLGLITGLLTRLSALGLIAITASGTVCTARTKVMEQNPVDLVDCVGCYLWRVEGLYIIFGLLVEVLGAGVISLDHLLGLNL